MASRILDTGIQDKISRQCKPIFEGITDTHLGMPRRNTKTFEFSFIEIVLISARTVVMRCIFNNPANFGWIYAFADFSHITGIKSLLWEVVWRSVISICPS